MDPYVQRPGIDLFWTKSAVSGRVVVVFQGYLNRRGLALIPQRSRAVRSGDVHEMLLTDDGDAGPGRSVDRVAGLGFVEFLTGGVLLVGDDVKIGDRQVGRVVGFDETHMPNHMNIVIFASPALCGRDLGITNGDTVVLIQHSDR
jgi:predicted RNA-binding protein with TRAM domain